MNTDRHRPNYYQEYAERTGRKDRHREGYYKDYYLRRYPGRDDVVVDRIEIPEGYTYIKDRCLIVPDWSLPLIEKYDSKIQTFTKNKDGKLVHLRYGQGDKPKYYITDDYLEVLKWWDEEDRKHSDNNINQNIEIKSIEEIDPEWWDDDEE